MRTADQNSSENSTVRPHVLLVDDDEASRKLLARALEHAGFEASQAADGNQALASITKKTPDVLLLDLQMPGLDGSETCKILRANDDPAVRDLPVIMLTAQDDEEAEVQCLEAGANDFLAKPVGRAALTARLQTQLRLRMLALELRARNEELERWRTNQLADLEAAKLTQSAIIPTRPPTVPNWKLESVFEPLIQVGGDVYGWRALPDGRCVLWIADATGHGAAAALVTTMVAHLFQQASHSSDEPDQILRDVNAEYFSVFRGKSFISALCALLLQDGSIVFSSAGHQPLLVARTDRSVETFMAGATMIGLTSKLAAVKTHTRLNPGEHLFVYTDGLYSLRLSSGERMTYEDVKSVLSSADRSNSVIGPVLDEIKKLGADSAFDDDMTVIAAGYRTHEQGP